MVRKKICDHVRINKTSFFIKGIYLNRKTHRKYAMVVNVHVLDQNVSMYLYKVCI